MFRKLGFGISTICCAVIVFACSGPSSGQLHGVIIEDTGEPLVADVSLFKCAPDSSENDCTLEFGSNQIATSSDESGVFQLDEVPLGKYAISIGNSKLGPLTIVDQQKWYVEIEAGKLVDIGEIMVSKP